MIPYYCKTCGRLDEEGISGHDTSRCKVPKIILMDNEVVANSEPVVANKRTKDRHKNKEARLAYARELMRKKRAEAKARA